MYICCSCDEHYGGDALACAKGIAAGTKTPCACDCHKAVKAVRAENLGYDELLKLHMSQLLAIDERLWRIEATLKDAYAPARIRQEVRNLRNKLLTMIEAAKAESEAF